VENGHSYSGVPRFYKHALEAAKIASQHFEQEQVDIVLNLGDIIDGKCQDLSMDQWISEYNQYTEDDDILAKNPGYHALLAAIDALQGYKGRILHTYGNHELYNVHREILGQKLNIPFVREPCGDLVGYYSYQLTKTGSTFRFVVIDSYDISIMKRCTESSLKRKKAEKILTEKNPNFPHRENSPDGLVGVNRRFVAFNGAVDTPQLSWLRQTLQEAKDKNERVVILSHQPILPGSSSPMCLIWNYQEVLGILREYAGVVAAAFAGHAHKGGYKRDDVSGIHFHVFEAVLESAEPIKTYAFVDVYEQHLVIRGMGNCRSAIYDLDHLT
jgi:manganese-dependent ADP-ribose/CDP-alcohol diphosphatase